MLRRESSSTWFISALLYGACAADRRGAGEGLADWPVTLPGEAATCTFPFGDRVVVVDVRLAGRGSEAAKALLGCGLTLVVRGQWLLAVDAGGGERLGDQVAPSGCCEWYQARTPWLFDIPDVPACESARGCSCTPYLPESLSGLELAVAARIEPYVDMPASDKL